MPTKLTEENGGKTLVVRVSGKLIKADYARFVPEFDRLVLKHGKIRSLVDMTIFHGWEMSAAWEDLKLGLKHFLDFERLAMIEETKWPRGTAAFCKPFTGAVIRYFDHVDTVAARQWLNEA